MNKFDILKKMLPGLLPLVIFIIADEIWGTKIGLYVAVATGIVEIIWIYIKEKRIDKFVLFDTGLIVVLGLVSILLENDIFFKLKPALIGLIFCAILGISAFSKINIMAGMTQRYMKGMPKNEAAEKQMNKSVRTLFFLFLIHTALVFYSAFFMSKEAWAFISGVLFYALFAAYFAYEIIKNKLNLKKQLKNEEWLPLVDEEGRVVGKATRTACHSNKEFLHPVVHLHVFNKKRELFLQKRPMNKLVQPGKWDTAVGGHIDLNEKIEDALKRESFEELNLKDFKAQFIAKYVWESELERELVFVFATQIDSTIEINKNELADGKFWKFDEIKKNLEKNIFTPNFEHEFSEYLIKLK
jgi:isopentenyldiphosphate isomerase/intracellular septation protein A